MLNVDITCFLYVCIGRAKNEQPPSRPLSPTRQLAIMRDIETELARQQLEPTTTDLEVIWLLT